MEEEQIDIHSEAVRDYLDKIPNGLITWGNTVVFSVVFGLFAISWFVHYPTIVTAPFRLTSHNAPKPIVVRSTGRLVRLFVKDNETVQTGQLLGYMESIADHTTIIQLHEELKQLQVLTNQGYFGQLATFPASQFQQLGEVQAAYQNFMQSYTQVLTLFSNGYYKQRKGFLKNELTDLEQNNEQLINQYLIVQRDRQLALKEFEIQKKLYRDKVISTLDFQREESKYINKQLPVKQLDIGITNNTTAQTQKKKEIADLDRQALEQKSQFGQALNTLISAVEDWEKRYLLQAPTDGNIQFVNILEENQTLQTNTEIMFVEAKTHHFFGEIRISQNNLGKVSKGQKVLIKFPSYPFEEYGAVEGRVASISEIATQENRTFLATVELPNGLKTNSNKTLTYKNGIDASAEIVTEDLRLIERFLYQLKRAIESR
jgi:multidrug resistance efflux pump